MVSRNNEPIVYNSRSGCSFSLVGDMFVKELNWDMDNNWFSTYKKLREYEPRLVEVYEYSDRKIYMKHIDGVPLIDNVTLDGYIQACDILVNIGKWCLENNIWFINHAGNLANFMIENNTEKIYMIDVDSFHFYSKSKKKL